jgi:DNA-binding response OmpR family regulator
VDDEPDLTSLFKMALEFGGYYVDIFNDSVDVLKNFKPHFYDLVILDIVMPDINGFKLYKQLKKVDPDINICFLSASEKHRDAISAEGYCEDLFLFKPISIEDVLKEVNKRVNGKTKKYLNS